MSFYGDFADMCVVFLITMNPSRGVIYLVIIIIGIPIGDCELEFLVVDEEILLLRYKKAVYELLCL